MMGAENLSFAAEIADFQPQIILVFLEDNFQMRRKLFGTLKFRTGWGAVASKPRRY